MLDEQHNFPRIEIGSTAVPWHSGGTSEVPLPVAPPTLSPVIMSVHNANATLPRTHVLTRTGKWEVAKAPCGLGARHVPATRRAFQNVLSSGTTLMVGARRQAPSSLKRRRLAAAAPMCARAYWRTCPGPPHCEGGRCWSLTGAAAAPHSPGNRAHGGRRTERRRTQSSSCVSRCAQPARRWRCAEAAPAPSPERYMRVRGPSWQPPSRCQRRQDAVSHKQGAPLVAKRAE
jgi:hypothetical protein